MATQQLAIRVQDGNPNHHLWNNNGTWFVHYTVYPDTVTTKRIRESLGTRCIKTARRKRDNLFRRLAVAPHEARLPGTGAAQ